MQIKTHGFALIRRPILSLNKLYEFHQAIDNDPTSFERQLIQIYQQPPMLKALYLASKPAYAMTKRLLDGNLDSGKQKLLKTLYKYFVRMSSRCTPFGLFAGCFMVDLSENTNIEFDHSMPLIRDHRLDISLLDQMFHSLLKNDKVKKQLLFYTNNSLYRAGNKYRYIRRSAADNQVNFQLTEVLAQPILNDILTHAKSGKTLSQLADLVCEFDISTKQAKKYIEQLFHSQIIVSELEANITGDHYAVVLNSKIQQIGYEGKVAQLLEFATKILSDNFVSNKDLDYIKDQSAQIINQRPASPVLQTNIFFPTKTAQISKSLINTILSEFDKIQPLCNRRTNPDLEQFAKSFYSRYQQKSIPLLTALDSDFGIGYGNLHTTTQCNVPLLADIDLYGKKQNSQKFDQLSSLRLILYQRATEQNLTTVHLTGQDLQILKERAPVRTAEGFYIFGSVRSDSASEADSGNFQFEIKTASGPSCASLIGRFCRGVNDDLTQKLRAAIRLEENLSPDAIFAEICHMPEPGIANILFRPHLRKYEIPYLTTSILSEQHRLELDDILVSVPDGKTILLTSKQLKKQIIPRLSNAHNFSTALPVYKFLCDHALQDSTYFSWDWGDLSEEFFLPAVHFGHLVLSKAIWNLDDRVLRKLNEASGSLKERWALINSKLGIPRYVQIGSDDRLLLIDTTNEVSLSLLTDSLRKNGKVKMTEFLEKPGAGLLSDQDGHYSNEIIIPFLREGEPTVIGQIPNLIFQQQRQFYTGSEWLYIKIYTPNVMMDYLLTEIIKPISDQLLRKKIIEKWFFIRYYDPEPHIRIRFYNRIPDNFWKVVLEKLTQALLPLTKQETIFNIQIDSYVRELERYGMIEYDQLESIFCADSISVASALSNFKGLEHKQERWLLALLGADEILKSIGMNSEGKSRVIEGLHRQFQKEFSASDSLIEMDRQYRKHASDIKNYLAQGQQQQSPIRFFKKRSIAITRIISSCGQINQPQLESLAGDLVHLFLNRWFNCDQRSQEFVIYHYLKKYYCFLRKTTSEP
ncbi:lantibiotic dehydratase [Dyadobacter psychrotolerans]|uniref:Lantibiotic dehydratase n=1 Tax=Dyadobacter psychrotolerans TaxID=2541721 RepID=A0A4R5D800_9BACT|nr:lantibiotic dehydratase [Dyadobacter psychrotolerans]TDE09556.1 hypothetical protein E0F88_30170 [Dyadobacter psychrotolerans]